jgi:hypothetical protein
MATNSGQCEIRKVYLLFIIYVFFILFICTFVFGIRVGPI